MKINNTFFKLLQFQNKVSFNGNKEQNLYNSVNYSTNATFLAPLPQDTVSFSGRKKTTSESKKNADSLTVNIVSKTSSHEDKKINQAERAPRNVTQVLYDDSAFAFDRLKSILREAFPKADVIDISAPNAESRITSALIDNADEPVAYIAVRRKKPHSISEKMAQLHVRNKVSAKEHINDIIGARIIVSSTDKKGGDYALDRLTESVKKGRFKLKRIKNHGQPQKSLNYASQPKIDKLINAARANGSKDCDFLDQPRDSGYLAVHILTENIDDGYSAEIQIMGRDVEKFKKIEDICYKSMCDKAVPQKYSEIKKLFSDVHNDPKLKEDYLEYTRRAYAYERRKEHTNTKKNNVLPFLPIPGDLKIPKGLDFNTIARYVEVADLNEESIHHDLEAKKRFLEAGKK